VQASESMFELLRITRSASIFDEVANLLVRRIRLALQVPSRADADTEAQFQSVREKLDGFFPRFREMYARLLATHLEGDLSAVVDSLRGEAVQRYFAASPDIDRALSMSLQQLAMEMVQSVYASDGN
jgi:hypothetical protein